MNPYYQDESVTIYHADCRDVLPTMDAAVMLTDPPFGIDYNSGWEGVLSRSIEGDKSVALRDEVLGMWGDLPALVFGSWKAPRPKNAARLGHSRRIRHGGFINSVEAFTPRDIRDWSWILRAAHFRCSLISPHAIDSTTGQGSPSRKTRCANERTSWQVS